MVNRATIEHSTSLSELYAKAIFSLEMSESAKTRLEENWKDFKENVEEAIKNIKGIPFNSNV